jgi:UDP-glucose 4-epimerase
LEAALKHKDIPIYGDGNQTRTFTYVEDTVNVINEIFKGHLLKNDVINIGNDKLITIKDLAQLIIRVSGSRSKLQFLPPLKEGDMTRRQPDNSKMREILKKDLITIEEGISRMVKDPVFLHSIGL